MANLLPLKSAKTPLSKTGVVLTKKSSFKVENRILMVCDYLQFMCRGTLNFLSELEDEKNDAVSIGDWTFKFLGRTSKMFNRMIRVDYNGEYFLTLLDTPRASSMKKDFVKIDVQNHFLYYTNYVSLLLKFLDDTGLKFNNLTRMDIALDGVYTKGRVLSRKTGKSSVWNHKGVLNFLGNKCHQSKGWIINGRGDYTFRGKKSDMSISTAYLGSRKSDAYIRIYNKREELKHSQKSYINDYFSANGFSEEDSLERIEFVFKGKHVAKFKEKFTLNRLLDEAYLGALCKEYFERVAMISRTNEDKNVSRRKLYSLIDWSNVVCGNLVRDIPPKPSKVRLAKQTIKDTHRRIASKVIDYHFGVALIDSFLKEFPCLVEWYEIKEPYFDFIEPSDDDDDLDPLFFLPEEKIDDHVYAILE